MTLPLFALAGLSIVGGLIDLPFATRNSSADPLARAGVRTFPRPSVSSFGVGFALSTIALVAAIVGIVWVVPCTATASRVRR